MTLTKLSTGALVVAATLLLTGVTLFSSPASTFTLRTPHADTIETKRLRLLMVGLAQDMARINTGLWHEDYGLIREGASAIANHPKIPPEQIAKIKRALGDQFQAFVKYDKGVHRTASKMVSAAEARNWSAVLDHYTRIRDGCLGCHTAYRERLRPALAPKKEP
jgi:cytochrome c556